ncbi:tRNA 5-methylaminomethyl-2-thiouridine biosynthesis bifunctional protein MnmC [Marinomonas spartinae]|uniref:NAD(P)/FAD-dependent oxidoreductase n=1 Tax=Marinomonas spartinae TaxID=1792290 RepID=UPI000808B88D|nr:FAD-dependent oxidoreductase [Marinomonas spartinae]SBS28165.1 tRNA 5-methylaminomethyl-2-thiouridine biosynthesis bifunctional protein MnmC [Marinomonas spartinae]
MTKETPHSSPPYYDVAIVGAGLAGSLCAQQLSRMGWSVCVIEKSRGSGGRASSKRLDQSTSCELGTPFISISHKATRPLFTALVEQGVAAYWSDAQAYVGIPKMSAITRHWLAKSNLITNTRIHYLEQDSLVTTNIWRLCDEQHQTVAQAKCLIITAPASQTAALLSTTQDINELFTSAHKAAQTTQPQWAMWLDTEPSAMPSIITPKSSSLQRLVKDSNKPNRGQSRAERWVIQASPEWTQHHLEENKSVVATLLCQAFFHETQLIPKNTGAPHRWLLARTEATNHQQPFMWHTQKNIGLAGDWLCQGDAEGALISALSLCDHLNQMRITR